MNITWARYFFDMAKTVSSKSKDPSTKVGAVIVNNDNEILSVGFNGFPRGVKDTEERYNDRPTKYKMVCHAEANAIAIAAKNGQKLAGGKLFIGWMPCSSCAKLLIQSGIKEIHIDGASKEWNDPILRDRWREEFILSRVMFGEAQVDIYIWGEKGVYAHWWGEYQNDGN